MKKRTGGLVYSTDTGRTCPTCRRGVADCRCRETGPAPKCDGIVRVGRETKGRKGAGVTLVTGVPLTGDALDALAKTLKQRVGSGGTVKDGVIELQGDHRDVVVADLSKNGWTGKPVRG